MTATAPAESDAATETDPPEHTTRRRRATTTWLPPLAFCALAIAGWELYVRSRGIADYVLPAPSTVAVEAVHMAPELPRHVRATATAALWGLVVSVVSGVTIAMTMAAWPLARRALYPVLVASQTVPGIVVAPILVVWLGFGMLPKVLVVVLVGFFPVAVATFEGLAGADRERMELIRGMGGGRRDVLRLVQLPEALPGAFAGIRIAATYATVGAVIGEWMGTSEGLGLVMTRAQRAFRADRVFVAIVAVALLSLALFGLVELASRLTMPWRRAERPRTR
ncbi:MAG: ABC transporter permease [Actinomycetota bacterium]|nr:ABC transporter permease [Actinomycetota bacterium]